MKRVWSGSSLHDTTHFKNLLEQAGIECFIKNRELGGALGDLPIFDCSPELWVLNDGEQIRAEAVLRDVVNAAARPGGPAWRCARCGEDNEAQFAACWRCGSADGRTGE